MAFNALLYTSLTIFILGLIYKISTWFSHRIGASAKDITAPARVSAAGRAILGVIFSQKILILIKALILDVVLQKRILKEDFLRWLMHVSLFGGFALLLLMHALDRILIEPLFTDYYPTLNPFLFLRDLFGVIVIVGLGIAVYRRFILKVPRLKTSPMDHYAIIILAVIILSGMVLEGVKITSYIEFQGMVENYGDLNDEGEMLALESFWVQEFGLVTPNVAGPFDQKLLARGRDMHETNCAACHSSLRWAFTGYTLAKILNPVALTLDRLGSSNFLWYIHFLACFLGLAYLPFSKMFHIIASPISLLVNAVTKNGGRSARANILTRQILELDACTHCGTCSLNCSACSAATSSEVLGNEYVLPSEKMVFLKRLAAGKDPNQQEMSTIKEGAYLCTMCDRCTMVCPVGINLQRFWIDLRHYLWEHGIRSESLIKLQRLILDSNNLLGEPNEERMKWGQKVDLAPVRRKTSRVVYFVGCVTSFFPATQVIAQAFTRTLRKAGVELVFLNGDEWCCGFPLFISGMKQEAGEYIKHNILKIEDVMKETGAKDLVLTCPACYRMFQDGYREFIQQDLQFNVFHSTQYLAQLITEGRIQLGELGRRVTYHDPCDLGRNSGIYEEPRSIIRSIPGIDFVELTNNQERAYCCGSGGVLLITNREMSLEISAKRVGEVLETKADFLVTACPSCIRGLTMGRIRQKARFKILDITQLVEMAGETGGV
nr:(Fe-S)-binding protein [Desulfobacterales bacterium]